MRKAIICPLCRSELEHTPQGWRCKICTFFYNIERGRVGPPLLEPVSMWVRRGEAVSVERAPTAPAEEGPLEDRFGQPRGKFKEFLEEHNIGPEMYRGLASAEGGIALKEQLRAAYRERGFTSS